MTREQERPRPKARRSPVQEMRHNHEGQPSACDSPSNDDPCLQVHNVRSPLSEGSAPEVPEPRGSGGSRVTLIIWIPRPDNTTRRVARGCHKLSRHHTLAVV